MYKFSQLSRAKLETCHEDLQRLFNQVIKVADCTIVCGHRGKADQDKAFAEKKSKLKFPKSKHNKYPSLAVDVMPCKVVNGKTIIDWNDLKFTWEFVCLVKQIALNLNIKIVCGADWNMNNNWKDEKFLDMPHYQLAE